MTTATNPMQPQALFQNNPATRQSSPTEPLDDILHRLASHPVAIDRAAHAERRERCRKLAVAFVARYHRVMPWPPMQCRIAEFVKGSDGPELMAKAGLTTADDVCEVVECMQDALIEIRKDKQV